PRGQFSRRGRFLVPAVTLRNRDWYVGLFEGGDLVVVHRGRIGFVGGSVGEVKVQGLGSFTHQDALPGARNSRRRRAADIRDKNSFPDGRAWRVLHVLNIKDQLGKAFIEDTGLDLEGDLR